MQFNIKPSERAFLVGKTGGGKTTLAKYLLTEVSKKWRIVIIDAKHDFLGEKPVWASGKEPGTIKKPHLVEQYDPDLRVQVFQPSSPAYKDPRLDDLCYDILDGRNCFVYIDDINRVATSTVIPNGINALWTEGRSLKVAAWAGAQRPMRIPEFLRSQAEHWFVFWIGGLKDRKFVAEETNTPGVVTDRLRGFRYYYYHEPTMDQAVRMPPLPGGKVKQL